MAANNNVIEKLREAVKACEEISAKDLKSQKEEIAKQFGELQKTVYEIIDEKAVILANLQWKREKIIVDQSVKIETVLRAKAEKIAMEHGYSAEVITEMLLTMNMYGHNERIYSLANAKRYKYWTLK